METILGALILLGFATPVVLALAALLFVALCFGTVMLQQPAMVAQNLIYAAVTFLLLFFVEHNAFALDSLLHVREPQPKLVVADERSRRAA